MTHHGSPWQSMANAVTRKLHKENNAEARKRYLWARAKFKHDNRYTRAAYLEAIEFNKTHGFKPSRLSHDRVMLRLYAANNIKVKVTLPSVSIQGRPEPDQRTVAEDRAIETLKQTVATLRFMLHELAQLPNPEPSYQNRISQIMIAQLIPKLCKCVRPALEHQVEEVPKVKMGHPSKGCVNCGGPARVQFNSEWYCEFCHPLESDQAHAVREASEKSRDARREIAALQRMIRSTNKEIGRVERKIRT